MGSNSNKSNEAQTIRVAVIADTHNRIPERLLSHLKSADEIWHLGDVCRPETLDSLKQLGPPLSIVQGNNDPSFHWKERLILERNGCRFKLQHLPPKEKDNGFDAILFAHTHVPERRQLIDGIALNPGAITRPRNGTKPSFAWLSIDHLGQWTWQIETLEK